MDVRLSKSGHNILSIRDKNLCSTIDPVKEAQRWVAKSLIGIKRNDFLILIGIGAGYHIEEIIKQHEIDKLIVVERNRRCINFFKENWPSLFLKLNIVNYKTENELLTNSEIRKAISKFFYIRTLPIVNDLFKDFVFETKKSLLGRSKLSFKIQSEEILGNSPNGLNDVNESNNLTWKVFDHSDNLVNFNIKDQYLIRALRELIV